MTRPCLSMIMALPLTPIPSSLRKAQSVASSMSTLTTLRSFPSAAEARDGEGEAGLLDGEEEIGAGPERLPRGFRALVPGPCPGIEGVGRIVLDCRDLSVGTASGPGDAAAGALDLDALGVEAASVVADDEQEVALGIAVAESGDGRNVGKGGEGKTLGFGRTLVDVASHHGSVRQLEELLCRQQIGVHLHGDAPVDRGNQVVGQAERAAPVAVVDVAGNGSDQQDDGGDADHRQGVAQPGPPTRFAATGMGNSQRRPSKPALRDVTRMQSGVPCNRHLSATVGRRQVP